MPLRGSPRLPDLLLVSALLLAPPRLLGQSTEVAADAGLNHALPPAGLGGTSATYANGGLRVRHSGNGRLLFAGLSGGVSLSDLVGSWGWGTAGGELSGVLSPDVSWGLSGVGSGFLVGDPSPYAAAVLRVRPELRVRIGEALLVVGARGELGRSEVGSAPTAVTTDLWSTGGDVEVRGVVGTTILRAGAGGLDATSGGYATGWLGLDRRLGPAWLHGEVRGWRTPGSAWEATGALRVSVDVGRALTAWFAGGRSDPDPLLGTPPGEFVGSGVSWRLFATDPTAALPARVLDSGEGRVAFSLESGRGRRVAVAGDFSGWQEVPLELRDGRWVVELTLEPGLYHYGFLVDGEWFVPEGAPGRTIDEWGRPTATLVVTSPGGGPGDAGAVTCGGPGSSHGGRVVGTEPRSAWTERLR